MFGLKRATPIPSRLPIVSRSTSRGRWPDMPHERPIARHLLLLVVLAIGTTCTLVACGLDRASQNSSSPAAYVPPPFTIALYFDPLVTYDDALRTVTDLGLQPSVACGYDADVKVGRVISEMQWQPAGQRSTFAVEHRLFVALTPLTAPDWNARLSRVRGILPNRDPKRLSQTLYCPDTSVGWGGSQTGSPTMSASASPTPPATSRSSYAPKVLTYAQIADSPNALAIFTPSVTYAEALYTISDLGMRLADPCYEHEHAGNPATSMPWPGGGQEQRFSASHTLLVAAAPLITPTNWNQMLGSQALVAKVTTPYTASC